ncbi:MAG: ABC transporter substrate-binding protein [Rhizobiales bacterium]|mgnify:CR=1 FL=1|nr:ABC transporter substrate-binding protein [Hyphomicrobiales bacterium]MBA70427.1 ABC transporter substrate-binding protein [Hyphomicrobiales bacterium]
MFTTGTAELVRRVRRRFTAACLGVLSVLMIAPLAIPSAAQADPVHAIAMHGKPALPPDFTHFLYANPKAPKGGKVSYGVVGTFDSLNPFILKSMRTTARGVIDQDFGNLVYEPLMMRSQGEPFTLYGLLAKSVEWDDDRTFIQFNINPDARWSDGEPVTAEDVIFTFELFRDHGRPPYSNRLDRVAKMEKVGDNSVRFTFNEDGNREIPLIIAFTPILPKHGIDPETFERSTLKPIVGSGPYTIGKVELGERITFERNPEYWAKDLPVKRGLDNYDTITIEYFLSENTLFEAFKKGVIDIYPDGAVTNWLRGYDFPAAREKRVIKESYKRQTPSGMFGFVFNTRRPVFQDKAVRKALTLLFDFEWVNKNLYENVYTRTQSYWQGTMLSSFKRSASSLEKQLLAPFPDAVDPDIMDGSFRLPVTDASGRDRRVQRAAFDLLTEAGYTIKNRQLVDENGRVLAFEVMTQNEGQEKLAIAYQRALAPLGIKMTIRTVDDAQYQQRTQKFDYDMIIKSYPSSLSPGIEQRGRWSSMAKDLPGSFNFAGVADPAVDAMIDAMLNAREQEEFQAAVRAFDRVLLSGYYVVPTYHLGEAYLAHWDRVTGPSGMTPLYGYYLPSWWDKSAGK